MITDRHWKLFWVWFCGLVAALLATAIIHMAYYADADLSSDAKRPVTDLYFDVGATFCLYLAAMLGFLFGNKERREPATMSNSHFRGALCISLLAILVLLWPYALVFLDGGDVQAIGEWLQKCPKYLAVLVMPVLGYFYAAEK